MYREACTYWRGVSEFTCGILNSWYFFESLLHKQWQEEWLCVLWKHLCMQKLCSVALEALVSIRTCQFSTAASWLANFSFDATSLADFG